MRRRLRGRHPVPDTRSDVAAIAPRGVRGAFDGVARIGPCASSMKRARVPCKPPPYVRLRRWARCNHVLRRFKMAGLASASATRRLRTQVGSIAAGRDRRNLNAQRCAGREQISCAQLGHAPGSDHESLRIQDGGLASSIATETAAHAGGLDHCGTRWAQLECAEILGVNTSLPVRLRHVPDHGSLPIRDAGLGNCSAARWWRTRAERPT